MICSRCLQVRTPIVASRHAPAQLLRPRRLSSFHAPEATQWMSAQLRKQPDTSALNPASQRLPQLSYSRHGRRQYSTESSTSPSPTSSRSDPPSPSSALQKPDYLDAAESQIWDRLVAKLSPTELVVRDVSGGCGSMYAIEVASANFAGKNMLQQQRMVNGVLSDLMGGWHGVQLRTRAP